MDQSATERLAGAAFGCLPPVGLDVVAALQMQVVELTEAVACAAGIYGIEPECRQVCSNNSAILFYCDEQVQWQGY